MVIGVDNLASYYDISEAIIYAADRGIRIMNISLAGPGISSTLQNAADYAWNKGSLIFAGAGNSSTSTPYYPAACNHVIGVSATDSNDNKASFSNYGDWVDIAAREFRYIRLQTEAAIVPRVARHSPRDCCRSWCTYHVC